MSVEFFPCDDCGETVCDCDYQACDCGKHFCSSDCGTDCGQVQTSGNDTMTCMFCRKEAISDQDLLQWCLERLDMTKEQASKKALK